MQTIHLAGLPPVSADPAALEPYLATTSFLDFTHPRVDAFVRDAIGSAEDPRERAVRLFYAVRDRIRYDPYRISYEAPAYRASRVIEDGYGWCVPKAGLLAACARAVGIPSAIGLADVINHLNTEKLRERMNGVNVFYNHGYAAMYIDGQWLKAVPAFNIELCERFGVRPTEFDGRHDALYQEFDVGNRRHMEYLADHGCWSDLPLDKIRADFAIHYPQLEARMKAATNEDPGRFEDDALSERGR